MKTYWVICDSSKPTQKVTSKINIQIKYREYHYDWYNRKINKFDIVIDSEKINLDHYITYFSNNTLNQNGLKLTFKLNSEKFTLPSGIEADGEIIGTDSLNVTIIKKAIQIFIS